MISLNIHKHVFDFVIDGQQHSALVQKMFSPKQFYTKIFKEQSSLKTYFSPTTLALQNWNANALIGDSRSCANTIRLTRYINS